MNDKYQGKYRIPSTRLPYFDYGSNAAYFVTICTKNRMHLFGHITNQKMKYSPIGEMVHKCWDQIPEHFPFVKLGEFIIMPNHLHGIIIIDKPVKMHVKTQDFASLPVIPNKNKPGPQSKNLASIVRGLKIGVTKYARKNTEIYDVWQPRFHEHIILDDDAFERISNYIKTNPQNWEKDKFHTQKQI